MSRLSTVAGVCAAALMLVPPAAGGQEAPAPAGATLRSVPVGPSPTTPSACAVDESSGARSAAPAACALSAVRADEGQAPAVDGRLDDPVWARAQPATGFRQAEPTPGEAASQRTEARVVYTDAAVYVGMRMYDTAPDQVRAQFVRRDDHEAVSDWASVMFDSYFDRRTSFEFATTPTGTRVDILHLDENAQDVAWDAVWDVATSRDAEGWTAEFRIPLSQLRFSGGDQLTWGINFTRKIARSSEVAYWAPIPPTSGKHVSLYGDLVGLERLSPPGGLEALPYTVGRLGRAPGSEANPFYKRNDMWGSGGLDLKYGITSNLTLTATMNPDFGQVEADPSEVNLTAFETFYAEKRPFFTEGTEIFRFPLLPEGHAFYSRRIGRAPQLSPSVPAGSFSDTPETARILGALKLSGKTASGWSVGLVEAVTGKVSADVSGPDGIVAQPLEPRTNYLAGRVSRDFRAGRSGVGLIATATNRSLDADAFDRLRSASYLGGTDFWHRFGKGSNYEVSGWWVGTHVRGSENAIAVTQRSAAHLFTRPDGEHLTYDPTRTSMNGWAGEFSARKRGGGNWTWTLGLGARSPGVEPNDLGFLSYADTWYGSVTARYSDFTRGAHLRNWYVNGQLVQAQTFGMENLRRSAHVNTRVTFLNFWQATLNTSFWGPRKWIWELRGGPALRLPGYAQARWIVRSDTRKPWGMTLQGRVQVDGQDAGHELTFDPQVDFRPTPRATVSLGPVATFEVNADQYVARVGSSSDPTYVVGRVDRHTVSMQARVSYGFSPTLNLDVYAQPFLSTGSYSDFRRVADPHAEDFDTRLPLLTGLALDEETNRYRNASLDFRNPEFNVREFRLNAVLRWEYLPGSTLFLVWTQARQDYEAFGDLELGRDFDRLFAAPATNVFMVKLNYWVGL